MLETSVNAEPAFSRRAIALIVQVKQLAVLWTEQGHPMWGAVHAAGASYPHAAESFCHVMGTWSLCFFYQPLTSLRVELKQGVNHVAPKHARTKFIIGRFLTFGVVLIPAEAATAPKEAAVVKCPAASSCIRQASC
jgi:hypothetical protein